MADRQKPLVVLGMPRHGERVTAAAARGFHRWATFGDCNVIPIEAQSSLLCHAFNELWAAALNIQNDGNPITHFAMIHSDVGPEQGWLDLLLAELQRLDADVLSAVIPIKDSRGLTSTAVATGNPWFSRRLSLHEVYGLPETFCSVDVGGLLLVNTGLWVADFTRPWRELVWFRTRDRIEKDENGRWQAKVQPEDWLFSRDLYARGCKVYATRKVKLQHDGDQSYPNNRPWGTWKTDESFTTAQAGGDGS